MLSSRLKLLLKNQNPLYLLFLIAFFLYLWKTALLRQNAKIKYPKECFCGEENYCLKPMANFYSNFQTKYFNCSLKLQLENLHLSDYWSKRDKLPSIEEVDLPLDLNFVTAVSSNHFNLSRGLIKQLKLQNPGSKVIYYDLGLTEAQIKEAKTWCNVEYKKFEFEKYPDHVKDLMNYAWKVLIIAEEFAKNRTFIYTDSSIRFHESYQLNKVFEFVKSRRIEPYTMLRHTFHSIFATTEPKFFDYIPLPKIISQRFREDTASIQLVVPVNYTREILKWKVLCVLTPDCIAPEGHQVECKFNTTDYYFTYRNCHRYDQSLFSTMIARQLFNEKMNDGIKMNFTQRSLFYTEDYVKDLIAKRQTRYTPIYKMFYLNRDDLINKPLISNCLT